MPSPECASLDVDKHDSFAWKCTLFKGVSWSDGGLGCTLIYKCCAVLCSSCQEGNPPHPYGPCPYHQEGLQSNIPGWQYYTKCFTSPLPAGRAALESLRLHTLMHSCHSMIEAYEASNEAINSRACSLSQPQPMLLSPRTVKHLPRRGTRFTRPAQITMSRKRKQANPPLEVSSTQAFTSLDAITTGMQHLRLADDSECLPRHTSAAAAAAGTQPAATSLSESRSTTPSGMNIRHNRAYNPLAGLIQAGTGSTCKSDLSRMRTAVLQCFVQDADAVLMFWCTLRFQDCYH
jgi:hypothetical protein